MEIAPPHLLFLGDAADQLAAKTAEGLARWRLGDCAGQLRLPGCAADCGLPDLTLEAGREAGARSLVVGVANRGGTLAESWLPTLLRALELGYDIAAGLHDRLSDRPELAEAARRHGRRLIDIRHADRRFPVASGRPRPGRRLLTVGTDCSVGKMVTALALTAALKDRGARATFRATGQTGILIAGGGVPVDALPGDFIAGAAEWLTPANDPDHWDIVEGQGSLYHPSYAGVSLGLLHGAQPEAMVLCHAPGRTTMRGLPDRPMPGLYETLTLNERMARIVCPQARVVGIALNTAHLSDRDAAALIADTAEKQVLPVVDPLRTGVGPLVDAILDL